MKKGLSLALVTIMILLLFPAVHAYATLYWPVLDSTTGQWTTYDGHGGAIDIAGGQAGKTVIAAFGGTVKKVSRCTVQGQHDGYTCQEGGYWSNGSYEPNCWNAGTGIRILGDDGRYYVYAHLQPGSNSHISLGQYVSAGQELGKVGQTGWATGPHLHFAISSTLGGLGDYDARPGCENYVYFGGNHTEISVPTITLSKTSFIVGETVNITWQASPNDSDFEHYWLVIRNTTNGKQYFGQATGGDGDVSKNYYDLSLTDAGAYKVDVYATNHSGGGKSDSKTFTVGEVDISKPTISFHYNSYTVGETAFISWTASSNKSDFKHYWLVIRNITNGKQYFGGATGGDGDVSKNFYDLFLTEAGTYRIDVYAVNHGGDSKSDSKTFVVKEACSHVYVSTVTKAATCIEPGVMTYTCVNGDDTYTESIPVTGNHVDEGNDGHCDTCGEMMQGDDHCNYCGRIHTGFFGMIVGFFHRILALFKR